MTTNPLDPAIIEKCYAMNSAEVKQAGSCNLAARDAACGIINDTHAFSARVMGFAGPAAHAVAGATMGLLCGDASIGALGALVGAFSGSLNPTKSDKSRV